MTLVVNSAGIGLVSELGNKQGFPFKIQTTRSINKSSFVLNYNYDLLEILLFYKSQKLEQPLPIWSAVVVISSVQKRAPILWTNSQY
jgi:hypothetical protein